MGSAISPIIGGILTNSFEDSHHFHNQLVRYQARYVELCEFGKVSPTIKHLPSFPQFTIRRNQIFSP